MKKKPTVVLTGQDGNIFNLMAVCTGALKKSGMREESSEMSKRVFKCKNYDEALSVMGEYVGIE